ncbi:helix-turn-helix domain-containing protein [Vibrio sp. SG41-7]|uniref:helix-turn-helix domain-containing protein n=1 Tax=Vibrio sp. SG41-7 TaxID=2760973 RepID=UPI002175A630|nr:helix-turn-helix domain-containing protein [Vibrio sp. SG41-7]
MKSVEEIATLLTEQRRKIGIEQKDMYMRIGMKQQQYQRIEAGSDVKLSTLLRVLEGSTWNSRSRPKAEKSIQLFKRVLFKVRAKPQKVTNYQMTGMTLVFGLALRINNE